MSPLSCRPTRMSLFQRTAIQTMLPKGTLKDLNFGGACPAFGLSVMNRYPVWKYVIIGFVAADRYAVYGAELLWRKSCRANFAGRCRPTAVVNLETLQAGGTWRMLKVERRTACFDGNSIKARF